LRSSSLLEARLNFVKRLLNESPLIGGSLQSYTEANFTENYYEIRDSLVGAVFWPIRVPCQAQYLDAVQLALEGIDEVTRLVSRTKGMRIVLTAEEMEYAHNDGEIGVLLGLEGGHILGSSVAVLRMFYSLGARFISLTSHECSNPWIAAATTREPLFEENIPTSITDFGKVSFIFLERTTVVATEDI
jgi:membrane dipeptidase